MKSIAFFQFSTEEDLSFVLEFSGLVLTGRVFEIKITERSSNTTKATLTNGSGITVTGTNVLEVAYAKAGMTGWARGEYSADVVDITGGGASRIMAVRFDYNLPGRLVHGVQDRKAYVNWSPTQAVVTATGAIGPTGAKGDKGDQGVQGAQGNTGPSGTIAVGGVTTGAAGSEAAVTNVGTSTAAILDFTIPEGAQGIQGSAGNNGWSPSFAVVTDGARRVLQVNDWAGGEGTKPATGDYVGATGLTPIIGDAVDIRGPAGTATIPDGDKGDITTSVSGDIWTLNDGAVGLAKLAASVYVDQPTAEAGVSETGVMNSQGTKWAIDAQVPVLPFAAPIGGSGTGQVPSNLQERFKHLANAKTDFGVEPWVDGIEGGTLKDNTAALQAAVDKLQPYGGALFMPPCEGGVSAVSTGPLLVRDGVGLDGKGIALIGNGVPNSTATITAKYDYGNGLKLAPASNASMFTIAPLAGHLIVENMNFDGLGSAQSQGHVFEFQNNDSGSYGFGPQFRNVYIHSAKGSGISQGRNRAKALYDTVWVEYCLAYSGAPAWLIDSFDTEILQPGIGVNAGVGLYLGSVAQFFMSGGAIWDNGTNNFVISNSALDAVIVGTSFDGAKGGHNVLVANYTADSRLASRKFIGCTWRQRPHGGFANNTWDDLNFVGNSVSLVSPTFQGPQSGSDAKVKYHVNGSGLISMSNPTWGAASFATAAVGPASAVRAAGAQDAYIGNVANLADLSVVRSGSEIARFGSRIQTFVDSEKSAPIPRFWMDETAATANNRKLMFDISGQELRAFVAADNELSFLQFFRLRRNGVSAAVVGLTSLPTSTSGLISGDLWNDGGVVKVVL